MWNISRAVGWLAPSRELARMRDNLGETLLRAHAKKTSFTEIRETTGSKSSCSGGPEWRFFRNPIAAKLRPRPGGTTFPIAGVGASAGGLEAFTELPAALPLDTGMAFVLTQWSCPQN